MIRVVIVDDHPVVREGLEALLSVDGTIKVAHCSPSGEDAVEWCRKNGAPDVLLCDMRLGSGMTGIETIAKLRRFYSGAKSLLLVGMPLSDEEAEARRIGANGYMSKNTTREKLVSAIRDIASGREPFVSDYVAQKQTILTNREFDIVKLLAEGCSREEIASKLGIGAETVRSHLKSIMCKLGVSKSAGVVAKAYKLGILRA